MPLSSVMHTMTASDGLKLAYSVDDFTDPWKPAETLILIHAAMGAPGVCTSGFHAVPSFQGGASRYAWAWTNRDSRAE